MRYTVKVVYKDGNESHELSYDSQANAFMGAGHLAIEIGRQYQNIDRPIYLEEVDDEGPEDDGPVVIISRSYKE